MKMDPVQQVIASRIPWLLALSLLLAACSGAADTVSETSQELSDPGKQLRSSTGESYDDYKIVTLLPRDAIPAIDNPEFMTAEEASGSYEDDELILGVEFNGDARAYSIPLLSSHEIVNDVVGGVKIAVTW